MVPDPYGNFRYANKRPIYVLETPIITAANIAVVRADVFMSIVIYVLQEDALTLETGNDLLENESFVIYLQ
ncbi:hypothetical protein BDA99DRAFT_560551 [Phascolomyces articulosus]|uniref:Uncharacterized protein n=1 Tax=Phascolomyces articulosus TaxID=60185 RepID=A0AAD5K917_9FUNG|nr:hypothetical protein BDA99DRAFT_560551 [Phascolomyces articulosus]